MHAGRKLADCYYSVLSWYTFWKAKAMILLVHFRKGSCSHKGWTYWVRVDVKQTSKSIIAWLWFTLIFCACRDQVNRVSYVPKTLKLDRYMLARWPMLLSNYYVHVFFPLVLCNILHEQFRPRDRIVVHKHAHQNVHLLLYPVFVVRREAHNNVITNTP